MNGRKFLMNGGFNAGFRPIWTFFFSCQKQKTALLGAVIYKLDEVVYCFLRQVKHMIRPAGQHATNKWPRNWYPGIAPVAVAFVGDGQ